MKLTFLGAAHEVTGSCTLLEACGKKILVDCGLEQGLDLYQNCELPIAPGEVDFLLLTHAHIDHSGKIPLLCAQGFSGPVYATGATCKLCGIMLLDSAHIQEFEAKWRNRKAERSGREPYVPLYTTADAARALTQFKPCSYEQEIALCPGITVKFTEAGHLLGSASITVTVTEGGQTKTLVFSGDLGNVNRPLICDPGQPQQADYVVIESTYGNRLHGERPDYIAVLQQILQTTFDRSGNVVIPSFAVGRTQELLYLIREIKEKRLVSGHDNFPVYVDSPLAAEATGIYSGEMREYYDAETLKLLDAGIDPIRFPNLRISVTSDESIAINEDPTPKVILSASGMCEAGRIRHHLKHNLWRKECTVLFVGYQAEGTLGRHLVDGAESVKLFGEEIKVNAQICTLQGISGHADQKILLHWLAGYQKKPEYVFVNHGNDEVCDAFAQTVQQQLGLNATAPYNGAVYELTPFKMLEKGNTQHVLPKRRQENARQDRTSAVFGRLQAAGQRLLRVIAKYAQGANKDIAKFADQIIALCDKWDK